MCRRLVLVLGRIESQRVEIFFLSVVSFFLLSGFVGWLWRCCALIGSLEFQIECQDLLLWLTPRSNSGRTTLARCRFARLLVVKKRH